jgi:pyruvate formate lyase activating enzyme
MQIAGLQSLSLVDFPGKIAATVYLQGCNFRCGYCHNPELIEVKETSVNEEEIIEKISRRKNMVEAVVITGGEPTVYKDLCPFIGRMKEQGFAVKLDTNGGNYDNLKRILEKCPPDFIALDIKTSPEKYHMLCPKKGIGGEFIESLRLIMFSGIAYELRTTCVPGLVEEADIERVADLVKGAQRYCIQQFRPYITLDEKFSGIGPYPKTKLSRFKDILSSSVQDVYIRGI